MKLPAHRTGHSLLIYYQIFPKIIFFFYINEVFDYIYIKFISEKVALFSRIQRSKGSRIRV